VGLSHCKASTFIQLYRYFVSQSSEFCRHNPSCFFSTSVYCCCSFRYRLSPKLWHASNGIRTHYRSFQVARDSLATTALGSAQLAFFFFESTSIVFRVYRIKCQMLTFITVPHLTCRVCDSSRAGRVLCAPAPATDCHAMPYSHIKNTVTSSQCQNMNFAFGDVTKPTNRHGL
jgi:hypothetical protein